jgi:hypothetical protein
MESIAVEEEERQGEGGFRNDSSSKVAVNLFGAEESGKCIPEPILAY